MMHKKPNILLVMPDEMRGDCMSIEDHPVLETPNMDSIGNGGTYFRSAYSTCPSCIAARRSLLTGQFPPTHGMVGYKEGVPLPVPSVTDLLRDAGYATAIAGRYMHQSPKENPYGFEKRVLGSTYIRDDDYARDLDAGAPDLGGIRGIGLSCNGREAKAWPVDDQLHPSSWTVAQARRLITESDGDRPMFLATSFYSPHSPLFPPAKYMDQYLAMELPPLATGNWATAPARETFEENADANRVDLNDDERRRMQAGYYGLIKHIDDLMGDLLSEFKKKSEEMGRPWLIVFTADHGDMLGDHYLFRKCEPYEGSARIPFLIQGSPDLGFVAGNSCRSAVGLEDIMPTFLELAELPVPDYVDGKSLVPVLRGETETVRTILHSEHSYCYDKEQGFHMLTDGRMKFIWRPINGEEQLFDLDADPQELSNLTALPERAGDVSTWRNELIKRLADRAEGFSDGTQLIAGCDYPAVLPHAVNDR